MSQEYARGSDNAPRYIFGKENINWKGAKKASQKHLPGSVEDIRKELQDTHEAYFMDDEALDDTIPEENDNLDYLDYLNENIETRNEPEEDNNLDYLDYIQHKEK